MKERERERMALGFFRGRDFETCLSALKSREIKEAPRPKPGEHVRMREDDEEARPRRRKRREGEMQGIHTEGWTDRAGEKSGKK